MLSRLPIVDVCEYLDEKLVRKVEDKARPPVSGDLMASSGLWESSGNPSLPVGLFPLVQSGSMLLSNCCSFSWSLMMVLNPKQDLPEKDLGVG